MLRSVQAPLVAVVAKFSMASRGDTVTLRNGGWEDGRMDTATLNEARTREAEVGTGGGKGAVERGKD